MLDERPRLVFEALWHWIRFCVYRLVFRHYWQSLILESHPPQVTVIELLVVAKKLEIFAYEWFG